MSIKTKNRKRNTKWDNLFTSFLQTNQRTQPSIAVAAVVIVKRERFTRWHRVMEKCIFQNNYDKAYRIAQHMQSYILKDEYGDENVDATLTHTMQYLDVFKTWCAYNSYKQYPKSLEHCLSLVNTCSQLYPLLHVVLVGWCFQDGRIDEATKHCIRGLEHIFDKFDKMQDANADLPSDLPFFTATKLGDNSPLYCMSVLYAFSRLLRIDIESIVTTFCATHPTYEGSFKRIAQNVTVFPHSCCFGGSLEEHFEFLKTSLSKHRHVVVNFYQNCCISSPTYIDAGHHSEKHCTMKLVVICKPTAHFLVIAPSLQELQKLLITIIEDAVVQDMKKYVTYSIPALPLGVKRTKKKKLLLRLGKPYHCADYSILNCTKLDYKVQKIIRPFFTQMVKHMKKHYYLDAEICTLFLNSVFKSNNSSTFTPTLKVLDRLFSTVKLNYRSTGRPNNGRQNGLETFVKRQTSDICYALKKWRECVERTIFSMIHKSSISNTVALKLTNYTKIRDHVATCRDSKCICQILLNRKSSNTQNTQKNNQTKTTQTNFKKTTSRHKKTQTDVDLCEVIAKNNELELQVIELNEKNNNLVKSLRKDLSNSKRIILDKDKEINDQKLLIETLQDKIVELSKPLVPVDKPSDPDLESFNKAVLKENQKLHTVNTNVIKEKRIMQLQLKDMTNEVEQLQNYKGVLESNNEEYKALYKQKSEQYDEIYNKIKILTDEEAKRTQKEREKVSSTINIILTGINKFVDLIINKINEYKRRCECVIIELDNLFHSLGTPNLNIKQMCDGNRLFLVCVIRKLDQNIQVLLASKNTFQISLVNDTLDKFLLKLTDVDWPDVVVCCDEFCSALFTQYIAVLNSAMILHTSMSNVLIENARLVNQTLRMNDSADSDISCPPLGPVGSNRPQSTLSNFASVVRSSSPDFDARTKNILSLLGHAVNYPEDLTLASTTAQPRADLNFNQSWSNVVENCAPSTSQQQHFVPDFKSRQNRFYQQGGTPKPMLSQNNGNFNSNPNTCYSETQNLGMKDNYSWPPPSNVAVNTQAQAVANLPQQQIPGPYSDCADFTALNGKYRAIFLAVKKRFPTALMSDLTNALNFLKNMNMSLHNLPIENIFEHVGCYIEHQMQIRRKNIDVLEPKTTVVDEYCSICFDKLNLKPKLVLKCFHVFHEQCISIWFRQNNVCPICRRFTTID